MGLPAWTYSSSAEEDSSCHQPKKRRGKKRVSFGRAQDKFRAATTQIKGKPKPSEKMAMDNRRYKLKTKRAASEGGKPGGSCKVRK